VNKTLTTLALALAMSCPAWAGGDSSDGHTHAAPEPVRNQASAPRAAAFSEEFEAVVVLEGRQLLLYLDRFASNAPVDGAQVEIEGGGLKGAAAETSPGVYAMDGVALAPGSHALTIAIETADSADLLTATLEIATAQPAAHTHGWSEWASWLGAGAIALAGGLLIAARRRKQRKGVK
jgi:hypothetical protein